MYRGFFSHQKEKKYGKSTVNGCPGKNVFFFDIQLITLTNVVSFLKQKKQCFKRLHQLMPCDLGFVVGKSNIGYIIFCFLEQI